MNKETLCKWLGHKPDMQAWEESYDTICSRCKDRNYELWQRGYLQRPVYWFKWRVWSRFKAWFLYDFLKRDLPF